MMQRKFQCLQHVKSEIEKPFEIEHLKKKIRK